ncbi:MAG: tetratricopeptide repeat protein, partial [Rickettsiaceae bacterium]|nr:tetratricopeptide repeat protein [Rickettsiaceae bacterium]
MKNLLAITFLILSSVYTTYGANISIKLVFVSSFSNSFQSGEEWEDVDENDVKNYIISRVSADYSPFGISVSTSTGNLIAYIGRIGSGYGLAVSGIGSYITGSAVAEIYSNSFAADSEWQGNNATISRIGETIASTTSHEIGHLINLYHSYMFDSFDPTITGALNASYQPQEPEYLPSSCTSDPNRYKHLMATRSFITLEQRATINRYFSANSNQIINFAKYGGYTVTRNMTWGINNSNFFQENNISINSNNTLIIATGNYTHNINNKWINGGKIIKEGTVTGYTHYSVSGSDYKGFFPSSTSIQQIINWASSGWDIYLGSGTYSENLDMKANVDVNGYPSLPVINGTITINNDDNVRVEYLKVKNKITITNSDNVYLNIRSDHPYCYVEAVNSDIYFYDPYFFQTQSKAFYGHDNGHAEFFKGSFNNKTSQGVYLHYWATADFTESIFCSNAFDINATGMCYAWINNYGYFSSSQYRSTVTSTVSVSPYQWYYCGSTAMAKTSTNSVGDVNNTYSINEDSDKSEYEAAMNDYRTIKTLLRDDREKEISQDPNKYKTDYNRTIDAFKNVVEKYPSSNEAILSLDRIGACYRALGEYENLSNYNSSMAKNNTLRPHALNIEKHSLVKQGKYKEAIELSDQIISEFPKHDLAVELLYSKGLIYNYYLNDTEKAAEMFKEVIAKYPNEMTAESAREALDNLGKTFDEREQILADEKTNFAVENYP